SVVLLLQALEHGSTARREVEVVAWDQGSGQILGFAPRQSRERDGCFDVVECGHALGGADHPLASTSPLWYTGADDHQVRLTNLGGEPPLESGQRVVEEGLSGSRIGDDEGLAVHRGAAFEMQHLMATVAQLPRERAVRADAPVAPRGLGGW